MARLKPHCSEESPRSATLFVSVSASVWLVLVSWRNILPRFYANEMNPYPPDHHARHQSREHRIQRHIANLATELLNSRSVRPGGVLLDLFRDMVENRDDCSSRVWCSDVGAAMSLMFIVQNNWDSASYFDGKHLSRNHSGVVALFDLWNGHRGPARPLLDQRYRLHLQRQVIKPESPRKRSGKSKPGDR